MSSSENQREKRKIMSSSENQRIKGESTASTKLKKLRSAMTGWKDFQEVETKVGPYVSQVIDKALQQKGKGYDSASEVLEDYKIFNCLLTKLTVAKDMLSVPIFAAEYFSGKAILRKSEMLSGFSTIPSDSLSDKEKKWISELLLKEGDPAELLEYTKMFIHRIHTMVEQFELKIQAEIFKQLNEKLKQLETFHVIHNNFKASVRNFEELNHVISVEEKLLKSLVERNSTYYETLYSVKRNSLYLEDKFCQCLDEDNVEDDLVGQWVKVSQSMVAVTQKEKELEEEARKISENNRLEFLVSSG